jgi:hypothetical protein
MLETWKKNGSGALAEEVWNLEKFSNTLLYSIVIV